MKRLFVAVSALLLPFLAVAQFSLSGKITDQQTGKSLPGTTISIENTTFRTVSDNSGYFRINSLSAGSYRLMVSFIGYQQVKQNITLKKDQIQDFSLEYNSVITDDIIVRSTRAGQNSATTYTNLGKKDLEKNNLGQDLPYLLNATPSVVIASDAGTGIGYSGIRIRGSDATRINVTINGIPYNDSESQGAIFVDLPDFASSVDNIQIQRGVGTSTNGAGAFGASINVQTTTRNDTAYAELNNAAGSYGTLKNTVNLGSGLIGGKFTFDGRLSRIQSDGYIENAGSKLKSYFLSGAYYGKSSLIRLNVFSGTERTQQAWNGVPEAYLETNRRFNELGIMPDKKRYANQTDNYTQNHYQLLFNQNISNRLSFNGALHYTKGSGYYEEYKESQAFSKYGLDSVAAGNTFIKNTDLVRRLWLDNDFYGITYAFNYTAKENVHFTLGGAYNEYRGDHFGNIIWTQKSSNITPDYQYYRDEARKNDFNIFGKADVRFGDLKLFADVQYRHVYYSFLGFDRDLKNIQQNAALNFFNPKVGLSYQLGAENNVYASFAIGNREPNRNDYTQSTPDSRPKPENLKDLEIGYRTTQASFNAGINGFYMSYDNQLVLTGSLNDVGAQIRSNVKDSYRAGVELDGKVKLNPQFSWASTAALSTNKVNNFSQFLYDDATDSFVETNFKKTNIAFSPAFVGSSEFSFRPIKNGQISLISKYVSEQFLDNTENNSRKLDAYFVNDVRLSYNFSLRTVKNIGLIFQVNNVFSELYSPNGATYPGIEGGVVNNYNYYFPQAPRNFLAAINLKF
ncbi:MAG: TonB-dependent receptor [Sphingobacteriaceae bacterium]